jgi:phosphatidate phosphatase APP1
MMTWSQWVAYIDVVVEAGLEPGWRSVRLQRVGAEPVEAPVRILAPDVRFAVVSDIDDTIMVTALPRPLLGAWNTFVLDEYARSPVPGMAVLYERLVTAHPNAPVFYLSTGAWNVAPALTRFLSRNLYPPGPLLLTDWGPDVRSLVPERAGAQAGDARTACGGVPGHPLVAHRRRRAARPGDLRQLRRVTSRQRRRGGHPAAVSDAIGARRWSA